MIEITLTVARYAPLPSIFGSMLWKYQVRVILSYFFMKAAALSKLSTLCPRIRYGSLLTSSKGRGAFFR